MLGRRRSPELMSTAELWLGIVWVSAMGSLVLYLNWPVVVPMRLGFASFIGIGFCAVLEGMIILNVWLSLAELRRRKKKANQDNLDYQEADIHRESK